MSTTPGPYPYPSEVDQLDPQSYTVPRDACRSAAG